MKARRGGGEATERERKLTGLHTYTRELLRAETRQETARIAVEAAHDVIDAPLAGFHDYDPETNELRPLALVGSEPDALDGPPTYRRDPDDRVDQFVWSVFEAGEPLIVDDIRDHDETVAKLSPSRSGIVYPLADEGVFVITALEADAFDASDRALVDIITDALLAALHRVERERLLQEREQQLTRENDRLDEFAGVVSHDLRNPLTVARGHVGLAAEKTEDDAVSSHLDNAETAFDRMETLIEDLLTLARDGRVVETTEQLRLAAVARQAWNRIDTADATLDVRLDDATVAGDRSRLGELFENLFRNAVQHGGESVTVTVDALGERAGFYVADDGAGIDADDDTRVFDRDYTTSDDGTGFGLRIVRDIAEGHGWTAETTDSEADGARFEMTGVDELA